MVRAALLNTNRATSRNMRRPRGDQIGSSVAAKDRAFASLSIISVTDNDTDVCGKFGLLLSFR
eukprot:scaffold142013_cov38-Prasinocladus_malaysianus.AAC.1